MPQIQIYAVYDEKKTLSGYNVFTWEGPDQKMIVTPYTVKDAQAKFASLLDPSSVGTSSIPDRVFLNYDDDGNLQKINAQVTSQSSDSFHEVITSADDLSIKTLSDAEATKVDVEQKTSGDDVVGGSGINAEPPIK